MNAWKAYAAIALTAVLQVPLPENTPPWLRLLLAGVVGGGVWVVPPGRGMRTAKLPLPRPPDSPAPPYGF